MERGGQRKDGWRMAGKKLTHVQIFAVLMFIRRNKYRRREHVLYTN
jgi:hypothetical protein